MGISSGKVVVHLEYLYNYRVMCGACGAATIAARVEELVVFAMVHEAAELDA